MRLRPRSLALLAGLAAIASRVALGAPAAPLTPQQLGFVGTERAEVVSQCHRLGVVPVLRQSLDGYEETAAARIDAAAAAALSAAGFEVVPPDAYNKAYERFSHAVGGLYDPMLGTWRKEQASNVFANALREYFSAAEPGCIAIVRVFGVKGTISNNWATWDGVVESLDGEANGTLSRILLGGNRGGGTIPAISAGVQILNRELKVIFGRSGGVQLAAYVDRRHSGEDSNFLHVPRERLLGDDKRIARAFSVITLPLRFTPEEIAAGAGKAETQPSDLPRPPAGVPYEAASPLKVPREQLLGAVHRVVLTSVQSNGLAVPAEVAARYRSLVHERLEKLSWEVTESDALYAALGVAMRRAGGFYDPMTGKFDAERMRTAMRSALGSIGLNPAPDAVLVMAIGKTLANQKAGNAAWDGAEQSALTLGPALHHAKLFGGTEDGTAGEGTIAASSLELLLRDADGVVLYDGRGGIELVQQLSIKVQNSYPRTDYVQQFAERAPSELFKDPARDERAVEVALRPLLMSPEQIAAATAADAARAAGKPAPGAKR